MAAVTALSRFSQLFGRHSSIVIGMIHVDALPGTPKHCKSIAEIIGKACSEALIYKEASLDGVIIENMHDNPYINENVGPEVTAAMTAVCMEVKRTLPAMPCGVQVLTVANKQALAIAKACNFDFIRVEGFVFSHVADEGLVNSCAGELLRYRKQISADNVLVFTDIKKKHSSHMITSDVNLIETAKAAEFFLSDGVILTGTTTGSPANHHDLVDIRKSVKLPVLVGSGVTIENIQNYIQASALIVGSHFKKDGHWETAVDQYIKKDGHWESAVDQSRVKSFMTKVEHLRSLKDL